MVPGEGLCVGSTIGMSVSAATSNCVAVGIESMAASAVEGVGRFSLRSSHDAAPVGVRLTISDFNLGEEEKRTR